MGVDHYLVHVEVPLGVQLGNCHERFIIRSWVVSVIVGVVHHHSSVMEVCGQDKGLTEDPGNDCGHLWFAPRHHLTLSEADIVRGGESPIEINVIGIESSGLFPRPKTLTLFTLFKAFKYR